MTAYLLVRFILFTLRCLPFRYAVGLAYSYMRVLDACVPKLRRVARRNLDIAGLPDPEAIIDGMWRSLARNAAVFSRFPSIDATNIHRWIRYEGLEHYSAAKQRGRGVLFATAHLGNWELSAFAHALMSEPMNVVVRPLDNERLDDFVEGRRALSGNVIIGKRDAARSILSALRRNEPVGALIDQNALEREGVFIDFFGQRACAGSGFAKLAAHSGAAVIPGFALWSEQEGRYVLRFLTPVDIEGDVQQDTQRVHAAIEQTIREYPDQWLWIHRRWKTRPAGSEPIY